MKQLLHVLSSFSVFPLFHCWNYTYSRTVLTLLFAQTLTNVFKWNRMCFCNGQVDLHPHDHPVSVVLGVIAEFWEMLWAACVCAFVCVGVRVNKPLIAPWFPITCYHIKCKPLWILKQTRKYIQHNNEIEGKADDTFFVIKLKQYNCLLKPNMIRYVIVFDRKYLSIIFHSKTCFLQRKKTWWIEVQLIC